MDNFDFSGWATKANLRCSDGRVIMKDAFKHNDGQKVPLVWNHQHNDVNEVLGHALLENRDEGVYTYCKFNESESGKTAKELVRHGDIVALSIYANKLRQQGDNVVHGVIREVSLVMAGANPGAFIDDIICHGDESDGEAVIYTGEDVEINHADSETNDTKKEDKEVAEETKKTEENTSENKDKKTVKEVLGTLNEEQLDAVSYVVGKVIEEFSGEDEDDEDDENEAKHNFEGGNDTMKNNVFDQDEMKNGRVLTHADQEEIIKLAKSSAVGSLQAAIGIWCENNNLAHSFSDEDLETLFPEFKNLDPGAPDLLTRDQGWVTKVMNSVHKSPFSRVRTRQADARIAALRAKGYKKGEEKTVMANIRLLGRQTEPQTIYIKDELNRDDIVDITDFSIVDYEKRIMKMTMNEEVAMAIMVGDRREDGDPDKIHDDRIRPIWTDDDLYTIKADVDIAAMKTELNGTNTGANFGDDYIYAEAIIRSLLFAREQYKGSGVLEAYMAPHLVNVMLLARDLNGRRIYNNKADLASALNVSAIHEAEQFDGLVRTDEDGKKHKLLGIFVNLSNYQVGATKGGEITTFDQFDIDFNKQKFLMECRLSGALTEPYSAIALEEPVNA